jgi:fructose-1,6-bisphosphatase/inositol monophosphatase family enzyme
MSLESMSDVQVALAAAAAGAAVVRAAYGGEHLRHMKSDSDFATETDLEAEDAIVGVVASARPDDGVVGRRGRAAVTLVLRVVGLVLIPRSCGI